MSDQSLPSATHGRRRAEKSPGSHRVLAGVARVTLAGALVASMGGVLVAQSVEPDAEAAIVAAPALDLREDAFASRSELAGRLALEQIPAAVLTIEADGTSVQHSTRAATVAEALAEAGITVDENDIASTALAEPVHDGMTVGIKRVEVTQVTEQVVDPHGTERVETVNLDVGTERVTTEGVDGVASHTYRVTTIDGEEISREILVSAVRTERVDEVVSVGTRQPVVAQPRPTASASGTASSPSPVAPSTGPVATGSNREIGASLAAQRGWTGSEWACLDALWQRESNWNHLAMNSSSGAYGIPQSLPGSKMATVAADWRTNPATQITWGLNYIAGRYGTPCGAWSHSQARGWY